MTMKLNQKSATVVTSFSQTKFSTKDALSRDPLEFYLVWRRPWLRLRFAGGTPAPTDSPPGSFQIPGSISGASGGASAATRFVARQRKTASAETRTSAIQMRRKV